MTNFNRLKFHWAKILSALFFVLLLGAYANIFAIGQKYNPGETLDPSCPPGEVNCTVDINTIETDPVFSASSAYSISVGDITKLSNLSGTNTGDQNLSGLVPYSGGTSNINFGIHNLTADTNSLFVDSVNHRVGIGMTNPNNLFQVNNLINFDNTDFNTKLGYQAGKNVVVGAQLNTFVGYQAGLSNLVGSTNAANYNSAFGFQSLYSNTTGYYNTAHGAYSLYANTTGYNNTAVGTISLVSNTSGYSNTSTGDSSLYYNSTGFYNTANGAGSLSQNTSGHDNTATGGDAMYYNTTGLYNTANGSLSFYLNSTGSNDTAIGYQSLYSNTTGSNNTAIGYDSGHFITNGSTQNQTPNNSVYLGYDTRASANGDTNEIVIGASTIGNGSNTATIGNSSLLRTYLTGVNLKAGSATAGTSPLKFTSGSLLTAPEVGAVEFLTDAYYGTITTGAVRKQFAFTTDIATALNSYIPYTGGTSNVDIGIHNFTADTNSLFVDSVNHRVGVGTITPNQQFEITKNFRFPNTTRNGGSPFGIIYKDITPFIHNFNYGNNGTVTTDGSNTFIGIGSGNLTMGITAIVNYQSSYNTGYGSNTLTANTLGYSNTAIGVNTLTANTIGNNNTATGVWSLATNTSGIENTGNGVDTLFNNLDGNDNTAVGLGALYSNSSGNYNTSVGAFSLNKNTTTNYNTALGYLSGEYIANGVNYNITGSNSLFLGASTKALADGQTNQIVIGYGAIGNGSNSVTLGNSSIIKTILNGSVGIGNTGPSYTLQVGNNSVVGIVARFQNSTGTCDINPTTSTLSCSSDINLKKNITDLDNIQYNLKTIDTTNLSTLDKVLTLTPVAYNWNSELDTDSKHIGFIAQEMEQIFPNLVSTDPDTGLKSIGYANMTPYLVKAIQEMDLKLNNINNLEIENTWRDSISAWLANAENHITRIFTGEICLTEAGQESECINRSELKSLKALLNNIQSTQVVPTTPQIETCSDGIMNQDETSIDVGGVCPQIEQVPKTEVTPSVEPLSKEQIAPPVEQVPTPEIVTPAVSTELPSQ